MQYALLHGSLSVLNQQASSPAPSVLPGDAVLHGAGLRLRFREFNSEVQPTEPKQEVGCCSGHAANGCASSEQASDPGGECVDECPEERLGALIEELAVFAE